MAGLPDGVAFCVVCGRFDRELVVRKSGLKCIECIGRRHNRGFAQLQHQQATYILSKTAANRNAFVDGGTSKSFASPPVNCGCDPQDPNSPPARGSSGTRPAGVPRLALNGASDPLNSTRRQQSAPVLGSDARTTSNFPASQARTSSPDPNDSFVIVDAAMLTEVQPVPLLEIDFDQLKVTIRSARPVVFQTGVFVKTKETAVVYGIAVVDKLGREITCVKHRFSVIFPVLAALKAVGQHALPELPEKKVLGRFDEKFVEERRAAIESFLNSALDDPFFARHPRLVGLLGIEGMMREQERLKKDEGAQVGIVGNTTGSFGSLNQTGQTIPPSSTLHATQSDMENCKLGTVLGKGTFGTVRLGLLPSSSQLVAVKIMRLSSVSQGQIEALQSELDLLRTLDHPNIVRFLGITWKPDMKELYFFTEYVECGSIATMVTKFGALPLPVIQRYLRQILTGLAYLHSLEVVHRDIKGDNILVTKDGSVKLADFGCSTQLKSLEVDKEKEAITGTPMWMAPEALRGESQGLPADVWSIGCVGIEMLQKQPWRIGEKENIYTAMYRILKAMGNGAHPDGLPQEGEIDPLYRQFLLRCLVKEPEERPTANDLLDDPFFSQDYSNSGADTDGEDSPLSPRMGASPLGGGGGAGSGPVTNVGALIIGDEGL